MNNNVLDMPGKIVCEPRLILDDIPLFAPPASGDAREIVLVVAGGGLTINRVFKIRR